ncbi:MAG TPA: ATP-binding protein, partial [Gaiellaceae bacterium]|nr:ATP-binding protein [Gaiellaceae bacterium]
MTAATGAPQFLNRNSEREHLDTLLADVRAGHSAALVLRGEPGVGKTALMRYTARQAAGFRV